MITLLQSQTEIENARHLIYTFIATDPFLIFKNYVSNFCHSFFYSPLVSECMPWPSHQYRRERYDGGRNGTYLGGNDGNNSNGFVKGASPCLHYALGSSNQGEQTSAQWVRFAFHDFVTANTATGIEYVVLTRMY